jgi:hypothetical protein
MLYDDYSFKLHDRMFIIDRGFKHDGATCARLLFQRDGIHRAAALVHDYLYALRGNVEGHEYTRKDADDLFRDMLIEAGVKSWHVWAAYTAVRLFGRFTKNGRKWRL